MSAPASTADALMVMDDAIDALSNYGLLQGRQRDHVGQDLSLLTRDQMKEARAAVAELVEADLAVDKAEADMRARELAGPRPHSYGTGWEVRDAARLKEMEAALEAAHKRRAAALARVGGAK